MLLTPAPSELQDQRHNLSAETLVISQPDLILDLPANLVLFAQSKANYSVGVTLVHGRAHTQASWLGWLSALMSPMGIVIGRLVVQVVIVPGPAAVNSSLTICLADTSKAASPWKLCLQRTTARVAQLRFCP
jgi:hypothetical protein